MKDTYFNGYEYSGELLPCPFCGEHKSASPYISKERDKQVKEDHYVPSCSNCGCEIDGCFSTVSDAIAAWNNRKYHEPTYDFMSGFEAAKNHIKELINKSHIKKKDPGHLLDAKNTEK
jgi:Lar family restriction alleviation protein